MKHNVGDVVRIKSEEWYEKNMNECRDIEPIGGTIGFVKYMSEYCGMKATIIHLISSYYKIDIDNGYWDWEDYMFEDEDEIVPIKKEAIMVSKNYKLSDNISGFEELESIAEEHKCVAWKCGLITSYQLKPASFFLNWSYMMLKNQLPRLYKVEKVNEN